MTRAVLAALSLVLLTAGCSTTPPATAAAPPAPPAKVVLPNGQADPMIAEGVLISPGHALYRASGIGPGKLNAGAPESSPESFIDPAQFPGAALPPGVTVTEAQGMNALARIRENLEDQGLALQDVISMQVYLDNPPGADRADYAGWNRAYRQFFANTNLTSGDTNLVSLGTAPPSAPQLRNPTRPTRFAMEVQSLAVPGWLVEVQVDAVKPAG